MRATGIVPHVPANRAINNQGDGTLFDRTAFHYDEKTDTFRCPAGQTLVRMQLQRSKNRVRIRRRSRDLWRLFAETSLYSVAASLRGSPPA